MVISVRFKFFFYTALSLYLTLKNNTSFITRRYFNREVQCRPVFNFILIMFFFNYDVQVNDGVYFNLFAGQS